MIKLERPPHGDNARVLSPGLFKALHQGKRGGLLNLKDPQQQQTAMRLAHEADVLVETYRPGVMDKLGLSFAALRELNPRLVYVSLTGYGADGPWRDLAGHDINYLAAAGVVSLSYSPENGNCLNPGVPVADLNGATYALAAINAALLQRVRTGQGQHLDVSLTDCMAHWMNARRAVFQFSGLRSLSEQRARVSHRPAYGVFECADGHYLTLAALEQHFWLRLVDALSLDESKTENWAQHETRVAQAEQVNQHIAEALLSLSRSEALRRLRLADVPVMEVFCPDEIRTLAHLQERGLFNDDEAGLARFPVRMKGISNGT